VQIWDLLFSDHLIYAPVPYKGYTIRAKSKGVDDEEFKDVTKDWFVPFEENLYDEYSYESRVVYITQESKKIYLSRIFRRQKLDELGRDGQVCHMGAAPIDVVASGASSLRSLNDALLDFEKKNGIPQGELSQIELQTNDDGSKTDGKSTDPDLDRMSSLVSRDQAVKIAKCLSDGGSDAKVYVICKRSYKERIDLVCMLSKFLLRAGFSSLTVTSDCPMELILDMYANVVISDYLPKLKPNSGWKIVNLSPKDGEGGSRPRDDLLEGVLARVYGT
jgi:hypothetical protein